MGQGNGGIGMSVICDKCGKVIDDRTDLCFDDEEESE